MRLRKRKRELWELQRTVVTYVRIRELPLLFRVLRSFSLTRRTCSMCVRVRVYYRYGAAGVGLMVAFLTIMVITLLNLLIAFLTAAHSDVQKNAQAKVWCGVL